MRNLLGWLASTLVAIGLMAGSAMAQTQDQGQVTSSSTAGNEGKAARESRQERRTEERTQEHADTVRRNQHSEAATSHKIRHERHRLERNRIEGTPGKR